MHNASSPDTCSVVTVVTSNQYNVIIINNYYRGLVQSPCGKINVIMMLGGEGILVHDVLQLHCQQILALVMIMHSCG